MRNHAPFRLVDALMCCTTRHFCCPERNFSFFFFPPPALRSRSVCSPSLEMTRRLKCVVNVARSGSKVSCVCVSHSWSVSCQSSIMQSLWGMDDSSYIARASTFCRNWRSLRDATPARLRSCHRLWSRGEGKKKEGERPFFFLLIYTESVEPVQWCVVNLSSSQSPWPSIRPQDGRPVQSL